VLYLAFQDTVAWLMGDLQLQKSLFHSALTYVNLLQSGGSSRSLGGILMPTRLDLMQSKLHWQIRSTNLIEKLAFQKTVDKSDI